MSTNKTFFIFCAGSRRTAALASAIVLLAAISASVRAQQPAPPSSAVAPTDVVLTVGEVKITAAEFEKLLRTLPPDAAGALASMGKKGFAERYANLLSLAKEGEKRKVDQSETFQGMAAFQRLMLLGQTTLNDMVTSMGAVSADEVSFFYTSHQLDFLQVKVRGIYVPFVTDADASKADASKAAASKTAGAKPKLNETEARSKADSLRQRVKSGESMEALAKKESDHPTASKGGDFGFIRRGSGQFTPQIENAIFTLDKTELSQPIKDRFGFFIFQVEDKRSQPLDEVKPIIENGLRQQKLGELLQKVQDQYPVVYNQNYFTEQPAVPTLPGAVPVPGPASK